MKRDTGYPDDLEARLSEADLMLRDLEDDIPRIAACADPELPLREHCAAIRRALDGTRLPIRGWA